MRLDALHLVPLRRAGFDHVRVDRPLHQEVRLAQHLRLLLENADEFLADDLALLLWIGNTL